MVSKAYRFQWHALLLMVHGVKTDVSSNTIVELAKQNQTRMWANAQPDGRPAEHRWRPLFNAAKFG